MNQQLQAELEELIREVEAAIETTDDVEVREQRMSYWFKIADELCHSPYRRPQ